LRAATAWIGLNRHHAEDKTAEYTKTKAAVRRLDVEDKSREGNRRLTTVIQVRPLAWIPFLFVCFVCFAVAAEWFTAQPPAPFISMKIKRIGILTAGGDAPGLNAAIRAVGKACLGQYGI